MNARNHPGEGLRMDSGISARTSFRMNAARLFLRPFALGSSLLFLASLAHAQTAGAPVSPVSPTPSAPLQIRTDLLPPAPTIHDWQPRGRGVVGGTIVVTGTDLRPADFVAVIGPQKLKLPVRVGSASPTRIELDVPASTFGATGALVVGHTNTQSRTLETNYRIDEPRPTLESASAGPNPYPFQGRMLQLRVAEFPGVQLDADDVTFGGTCRFRPRTGVSHPPRARAADLSVEFTVPGWFEGSGDCTLEVTLRPIGPNGVQLAATKVSRSLTIGTPIEYSIASTSPLLAKLAPQLTHFGIGSICTGTPPGGQPVGPMESGGDLAFVARGGPLDVECGYRTKEWLLPEGVRVDYLVWKTTEVGYRCGMAGSFTHTFPAVTFPTVRGTVVVRPYSTTNVGELRQLSLEYWAFGDREIVVDGVQLASQLTGPRTLLKPMNVKLQCVSMAMPLQTASGTKLPTTEPQAFGLVLDRIVLRGPPGLTLP